MIRFIKNLKARKLNRGMTYVELIVVSSIFAIMSSVVIYNYQGFQAKVDIKNLASDIALKIVEAQKSSSNGVLPPSTFSITPDWKPSYGVYFEAVTPPTPLKQFIYFADLDGATLPQNGVFDGSDCTPECLDKITITRNDYISDIVMCSDTGCISSTPSSPLSITFKRTASGATFKDSNGTPITGDHIQITVKSANGDAKALIKIYPSGRVQVN